MESIGNILKDFIAKANIEEKIAISSIFNHWQEIVGKEISKRAKPEKLRKGVLFVSVTTSTWANELSLMSANLVGKINSYIGKSVVKEIRFKIEL